MDILFYYLCNTLLVISFIIYYLIFNILINIDEYYITKYIYYIMYLVGYRL